MTKEPPAKLNAWLVQSTMFLQFINFEDDTLNAIVDDRLIMHESILLVVSLECSFPH